MVNFNPLSEIINPAIEGMVDIMQRRRNEVEDAAAGLLSNITIFRAEQEVATMAAEAAATEQYRALKLAMQTVEAETIPSESHPVAQPATLEEAKVINLDEQGALRTAQAVALSQAEMQQSIIDLEATG